MYYDIAKSSVWIRELRVEMGCTQEFVAEQIGILLDGYRKLEHGETVQKWIHWLETAI